MNFPDDSSCKEDVFSLRLSLAWRKGVLYGEGENELIRKLFLSFGARDAPKNFETHTKLLYPTDHS